jgi:Immunoglobulin I-set domain
LTITQTVGCSLFVRYTWFKNGVPLEPKSNVQYLADGIQITDLSAFDEGYYNCHAENQFGVSVSNTSVLRRAVIGSYTTTTVRDEYDLEEGRPFVLRYQPLKCYPPPTFTWSTASSPTDQSPQLLVTSKRVQVDDEGMRVRTGNCLTLCSGYRGRRHETRT